MTPIRLRVDVCTFRGLRDGVPRVLESLKRASARATFFVTFGPDASGLAMRRMLNPAFAWKMLRTRAVRSYGLATAFYGTLLPAPLVGAGRPDLLRRIRGEGHEIGMHGWDHRRWQDRLPDYPASRLRDEFSRMCDAYEAALGARPEAFAAPAWCVTTDLLAAEEAAGLRYASDARGRSPFLPLLDGRIYRVPQRPATLPTLDEVLGAGSRDTFVHSILRLSGQQPDWCCLTAHAETEGGAYRREFEQLLARLDRPVAPLGEAEPGHPVPCPMGMRTLPGRPYDVCVQEN